MAFLFIAIFFAGCAEAGYQISIFKDGTIRQTFYVQLDEELITEAGYDITATKDQIINSIDDLIHGTGGLVEEFEAVDHGATPLEDLQIEQRIKAGIGYATEKDGVIGVTLNFSAYEDFRLFYRYDVEEPEPNEELVEETPFYIKTTTYSSTIFKNVPESSLLILFLEMFDDQPTIFNLNDVTFYHNYASYDTKLRSNADNVYYSNGLKVHSWQVGEETLERQIEFYEYDIIVLWWYVLALVLTITLMLIILVLHFMGVAKNKVADGVKNLATNIMIKNQKPTTKEKLKNKWEEIKKRKD